MATCTRCQSSGFLNIEQVPVEIVEAGHDAVLEWIDARNHARDTVSEICLCHIKAPCGRCELHHDVSVCDCCGDEADWYGEPGEHYGPDDPPGDSGPYRYNGGLCECH